MILPDFRGSSLAHEPFPTLRIPSVMSPRLAAAALTWFETSAPWRLKVTDFYEQYEFSLLSTDLPLEIAWLVTPNFVNAVQDALRGAFAVDGKVQLTEIAAHLLEPGQTIRIHNDHLGDAETHRLLVQLNTGWTLEMGGLLMLFASSQPEDVADVIVPEHNSGLAFEISQRSHHAVSTIQSGRRYTLVYTFGRLH